MKGLRKNLIYAIKPCLLGLCGPAEKEIKNLILNFLYGSKINEEKLIDYSKQLKSAFTYLKLIAKANKIKNPFDERVVEAYWIGNELLKNVSREKLIKAIRTDLKLSINELPDGVLPHHSFHVLFIGSLKNIAPIEKLASKCIINCGMVEKIEVKHIFIKTRPLVFFNHKAELGEEIIQEIGFDCKILPKVKVGDIVSYHWDFACEVIDKQQAENLTDNLRRNIDFYNSVR